ncbi:hypothetical protein SCA6_007804 [Theobroma cacao]
MMMMMMIMMILLPWKGLFALTIFSISIRQVKQYGELEAKGFYFMQRYLLASRPCRIRIECRFLFSRYAPKPRQFCSAALENDRVVSYSRLEKLSSKDMK